jgi:hypothetical protein
MLGNWRPSGVQWVLDGDPMEQKCPYLFTYVHSPPLYLIRETCMETCTYVLLLSKGADVLIEADERTGSWLLNERGTPIDLNLSLV